MGRQRYAGAFSRHTLERFIEEQQFDIFQTRQQRLIIETPEGLPVGALDLFDLDPVNLRAGVGILIHDTAQRGKGYAADAVETVCSYARDMLHLHQLWCSVEAGNAASLALSAMPDSPKRGSGKSGCGLPTDSTTRFSCKKYYDLRRLAQRHKTNPPPISPNSSGRKGPPGESFERGLRDGASKPFPGSRYAQCALF